MITLRGDENAITFFARHGFEYCPMGGGCTALVRWLGEPGNSAHVVVTVDDEPRHPSDHDQWVAVGLYDDSSCHLTDVGGLSWREAVAESVEMIRDYLKNHLN